MRAYIHAYTSHLRNSWVHIHYIHTYNNKNLFNCFFQLFVHVRNVFVHWIDFRPERIQHNVLILYFISYCSIVRRQRVLAHWCMYVCMYILMYVCMSCMYVCMYVVCMSCMYDRNTCSSQLAKFIYAPPNLLDFIVLNIHTYIHTFIKRSHIKNGCTIFS